MNQAAAIMCKKYSPRNERPVIIYSPEYHSFFYFLILTEMTEFSFVGE